MSYRQISDILKTVHQFHELITKEIQRHSQCNSDPRLELLADYVKHQRDAIAEAVRTDERDPTTDVQGTWLQFVPDEEVRTALDRLQLREGEPVGELFERVMEADRALLNLYELLSEQTSAQSVREFFKSLYRASLSFAEQRSWGLRDPAN